MKKETIIVAIILLICTLLLIIQPWKNAEEKATFQVNTPIDSYHLAMSSVPGMPFEVICDHKEKIQVKTNSGSIFEKNIQDIQKVYHVDCNHTVYWSPLIDILSDEMDSITITFSTDAHSETYTLIRNESYTYTFQSSQIND